MFAEIESEIWPLALYIALAVLVGGAMLGLSYILGGRSQKRKEPEPFECGIVPRGSANIRFRIKYFRIALYFVIFDLEVAFLVVWAVAARELGWNGYIGVVVFVFVLALTLVYLWRLGSLDWGTTAVERAQRQGRQGEVE